MSASVKALATVLCGVCLFVSCHGNGIPGIVDTKGDAVPLNNVSGCHFVSGGYNIVCPDHHQVAPVGYDFFFKPPDVQKQQRCETCYAAESPCYKICCAPYNVTTDCLLDSQPHKDLLARVDACDHKSNCPNQKLGWTGLTFDGASCASTFHSWTAIIYSQLARLYFYCIHDDWGVYFGSDNKKTGHALFLTSPKKFDDQDKGYNISCDVIAEAGSTIEMRALDFRLCTKAREYNTEGNTESCGQVFHVMEGGSDVSGFPIEVTPNDDDGKLGLETFYTSKSNKVTLKLDAVKLRDTRHTYSFSMWLYAKASQGQVTIDCSTPLRFTVAI